MATLAVSLIALLISVSVALPVIELPTVDFGLLVSDDSSTILAVSNALTTLGALQITGIPEYDRLRHEALVPLGGCLKDSLSDDSITQNMPDGSLRLTALASSSRGEAGPMTSNCGDSALRLRSAVDSATKKLFSALDRTSKLPRNINAPRADVMRPYSTFEDVLRNGEHLEHLHTYFSPSADAEVTSEKTFEYHTDAGLFIAMTTGLYSGEAPSEASGLYVELPSGVRAKAVLRDDALVILVGDGGARWLQSSSVVGAPLRAVPHALVAGLRPGSQSTRSWYGKMFLPPGDAVVPAAAGEEQQQQVTFEQYQQRHSRAVAAAKAEGRDSVPVAQTLPTACGRNTVSSSTSSSDRHLSVSGVRHRYFDVLSTATTCTTNGDKGINCWMRCVSVEDLPCGQSAECVDPATGQIVDGDTVTCPSCVPMCVSDNSTTTDDSLFDGYCYGTGVTMFMEGFTSIAYEPKGTTSCMNLWFLHWTLDDRVKYAFSCIGVMLLGIFVQYLNRLKRELGKLKTTWQNNLTIIAVNTVQLVSGYFAMLVAMTYSIELFCMICAGLIVGFAMFNVKAPASDSTDPTGASDAHEDDKSTMNTPFIFATRSNTSQR